MPRNDPSGSAGTSGHACLEGLEHEPIPLCSESLGVALLWNAKAGCTFAIKWLFFQEGLLEEAEAYAPWPHQYRRQVYYARAGHEQSVQRIPSLGPRAIKFVRNPFDRAVGGYLSYCIQAARETSPRHVLAVRGIARRIRRRDYIPAPGESNPQHARMLRAVSRHLGRGIGSGHLFTFREWVSFLETLDLDSADIHVRRQVHPCERAGLLEGLSIVRVEEADRTLPALEDELGLRRSDLASLGRSKHHSRRADEATFVGDEPFGDMLGSPVPASRWFYDPLLVQAVGRLYAEDIAAYGYEAPDETR